MSTSPLALDRRTLLSRISLFSELSPRDLDLLVEYTTVRSAKTREEIVHKGDVGSECYAILSGRCKVTSRSPEGKEITFAILDPGETFGEIAMLSDQRRTATVTALEACDLLMVRRRDLLPLLEREPTMAFKVMSALATQVARLTQQLEDTLFRGLPSRLARKLLALAENYGAKDERGVRIEMKLSQTELGNLVGTSRESVNKQIKQWARSGFLVHEEGQLWIQNTEELEKLANRIEI